MRKHLHVKYLLFLSNFNKTQIFSADFRNEKLRYVILSKLRSVRAELFYAEGRTDRQTDVTLAAFRNFANALKNTFARFFCQIVITWRLVIVISLRNVDPSGEELRLRFEVI
jgi:hypothetical protein